MTLESVDSVYQVSVHLSSSKSWNGVICQHNSFKQSYAST